VGRKGLAEPASQPRSAGNLASVKSRTYLIVVLLAVVAAACADAGGDDTTTTAEATTTSQATTTTTEMPAPSTTQGQADPGYMPRFVTSDCEFDVPFGTTPQCGYLIVPENRSDPDGAEVLLHVAVFPATSPNPEPDPIVYLEGGPGGHTLEALQFSYTTSYEPLLTNRDLILFDQRGVGFSEPALDCPELRAVDIEYLDDDVSDEVYQEAYTGALVECRDRLVDDGVDLTAYNSATNAADVADLRIALGYDEINLWGISYGTRLALTVMRDHPEGIRSVVLDSTVPIDLELIPAIPASADRAFDVFFAGCDADPMCASTYPDLETEFAALADRLDDAPVDILIEDFVGGDSYPGLLDGDGLYNLFFSSLYADSIIPLLPDFISDAAGGDYSGLERLSSLFFSNEAFVSVGMYLSVQCNEEYTFTSAAQVDDAVAMYPDVADMFGPAEAEFDDCAVWGAGTADPIEDEPVASDIPTLILAGEYDPITPPSYGRMAGETLTNSTFFEFPGLAHGVSTADECPTGILLSFVDDPMVEPDGSCIDMLGGPNFFIPGNVSVSLMPFEADVFGYTIVGLRPEEWDDTGNGSFTAPGLGDVAIVYQLIPSGGYTLDETADLLGGFYELDGDFSTRTHNDGARVWNLYRQDDGSMIFDIALHDDGSTIFIVVFVTTSDVRDVYLETVLYPSLAALAEG